MTFSTGMRKRNVPQRPSTPQAQTRSSEAAAPVALGGTSGRTPEEARTGLDVPGLGDNNVFTGSNEFQNGIYVSSGLVDATAANADFADISGAYTTVNTLDTNGLRVGYVAKTADYTVNTLLDCVIDVTSGSPTITLPTAVSAPGAFVIIKNSGAGTVTLATTSSQTIDGAAPGTVAAGGVIRLASTGSNWISV